MTAPRWRNLVALRVAARIMFFIIGLFCLSLALAGFTYHLVNVGAMALTQSNAGREHLQFETWHRTRLR